MALTISFKQAVILIAQLCTCLVSSYNDQSQLCEISADKRIDCYPETSPLSQLLCKKRGCCYDPYSTNQKDSVPWCFFPRNYSYSYMLTKFEVVASGYEGELQLLKSPSPYPPKCLSTLKLSIMLESADRLHFKITDANNSRYEVPIGVPTVSTKTKADTKYTVETSRLYQPFYLVVKRKKTNIAVFDTRAGPILFGDQFLQISTSLASSNIYGLGERHGHLRLDTYWHRVPFWAADHAPGFPEGGNLYGDHPFYLVLEPDGIAHGVFFLNSNAKEVELQSEPALTWRSIGGIMDFYVFLGQSPNQVVEQYTDVIGHPFLPPMWSLGYHLCRWGYKTANNTLYYVEKMRAAKIPQNGQTVGTFEQ